MVIALFTYAEMANEYYASSFISRELMTCYLILIDAGLNNISAMVLKKDYVMLVR